MRLSLRALSALSALALLAAGCGGPELIVKPLDGASKGRVYFKALQDGQGNDLQGAERETEIGDMPTDWEIPPELLGGKGRARVVFEDGRVRDVEWFPIRKDQDTVVRVAAPPRDPRAK